MCITFLISKTLDLICEPKMMITPEPSIYEIFWQIFELKADMMRCNPRLSSPKILMMKFFYEAENYINVEDDASDEIFNKDEVVERDPCAMTKTWVWMQSQLAATNRPTAAQPRKKLTWAPALANGRWTWTWWDLRLQDAPCRATCKPSTSTTMRIGRTFKSDGTMVMKFTSRFVESFTCDKCVEEHMPM